MTLQQLRYVTALADQRHFGRAAEASHVAQPTLTLQVKKLEDELGVQLFDRSSNPIQPTELGLKIIAQARLILNDVRGLENLLQEETNQMAGDFSLGIIPTLSPYLLPRFIRAFSEQFPDISLRIRELQSEEIISGLLDGSVDLGLLVTPLDERQLREIVLFYEPFLIYATPGEDILQHSPLLPDHLEQSDLWVLQQGHCFRNQVLNICGEGKTDESVYPNFRFEAGSIETLKNLVRSNPGYTIIPEMSIDEARDAAHVKRFAEPQPAREVSLVVNQHFYQERLLLELRKAILAVVPEDFRKGERFVGVQWR